MNVPTVRKLSLTALALVLALAWSLPGAAQETAFPTGGLTCTADLSPLSDQDAAIPAQTCGPCLLEFCGGFYIRCTFARCGLNDECCAYDCTCDPTCTSASIPGRVCLPLFLPGHCCGNGIQEDPEDCDLFDLGGKDCTDLGYFGGNLACFSNCSFNTTGCTNCGNGTKDPGEDCDGTDLGGTTCADLGFTGGSLACIPGSCTFDTSDCYVCGNDICEGNGEDCESCSHDCDSKKTGPPSGRYCCGNGVLEGPEGDGRCDGNP